jgi:hypothetical protein
MPRSAPPVPPEQLYPRRLAYHALTLALGRHELTSVAVRLNPDDQCLPGAEEDEFVFGEDIRRRWDPLAFVYLDGARARVIVENVERLIRPNHRRDFDAAEVGIFRSPGGPDIDVTVDLAGVIEVEGELLRTAPQRVPPPLSRPRRTPTVIRSKGAS